MNMTAEEWNEAYPVGQPVRYWPGAKEGPGRFGRTTSVAWELGEEPGDVVVMVHNEGNSSPITASSFDHVLIERVEPVTKPETRKLQGWIDVSSPKSWSHGQHKITGLDPFAFFADDLLGMSDIIIVVKDAETGETVRFEVVNGEVEQA